MRLLLVRGFRRGLSLRLAGAPRLAIFETRSTPSRFALSPSGQAMGTTNPSPTNLLATTPHGKGTSSLVPSRNPA